MLKRPESVRINILSIFIAVCRRGKRELARGKASGNPLLPNPFVCEQTLYRYRLSLPNLVCLRETMAGRLRGATMVMVSPFLELFPPLPDPSDYFRT